MAVLDQDGVYTYVSPLRHRPHRTGGHRPEGWEMARHPRHRGLPHGQPVLPRPSTPTAPPLPPFSRLTGMGSAGCFYVIVQGMEDAQNLTRRIGELAQQGGVLPAGAVPSGAHATD